MEVIADDDAKAVFSVLLIWGRDSTRIVSGQFGSGYTIVFWIGCCGESENTVPSKRPLQTVELSILTEVPLGGYTYDTNTNCDLP